MYENHIIYLNCGLNNEDIPVSEHCSNYEHYLGSKPASSSSVHLHYLICSSNNMIFTYSHSLIYSILYTFIMNLENAHLPVGLLGG